MTRIAFASVALIVLLWSPVAAGEETPSPEPGIYAAGELLCSLSDLEITDRPLQSDDGLPFLPQGVMAFDVVAPKEARRAGVRPGALRLVFKKPRLDHRPLKIIGTGYELDREDQERFRVILGKTLPAGSYRFGLEKPDFEAGTDLQALIHFFDCGFIVSEPAESQAAAPE